jgi:hypothetical protein
MLLCQLYISKVRPGQHSHTLPCLILRLQADRLAGSYGCARWITNGKQRASGGHRLPGRTPRKLAADYIMEFISAAVPDVIPVTISQGKSHPSPVYVTGMRPGPSGNA